MLIVGRSRDRIPVASVTGIFLVNTDRTMCPGVNSGSKKWVPLGVKAAGAWGWRPTTLAVPNVKKSGALTYPDPLGPSRRPVVGETFTFTLNSNTGRSPMQNTTWIGEDIWKLRPCVKCGFYNTNFRDAEHCSTTKPVISSCQFHH